MNPIMFGYVWLSVYDAEGAAKRMAAIHALDDEAFARFRASGGTSTTGVQPPIPPDAQLTRLADAGGIKVGFTEGTLESPDRHLIELSPVFASEKAAHDWLEQHAAVMKVGVANRVLLTVSARTGQS